ncbi:uncharacterized protein BJ171DRAFT_598506 [Polychytrium aggregatum]|uniref:uncharacterized protein n=1 Tax=Polychytrium aggregatum TaxID=110093 RepID=UPI0022FDF178|nr:uncharacterized protein BJ171DRAFT_598506 [Polychytrium aggregatum]KAI9205396.1 hypothetical protein BJ171DRAFT_598506 [Polychytrium aggregatum]
MSAILAEWVDQRVEIITHDGRVYLGTLKGLDQSTNVILTNTILRSFTREGTEDSPIGLFLVRGDNIALVGQIDEEDDQSIQWDQVRVDPLEPIRY